jgi:hypothetical protein
VARGIVAAGQDPLVQKIDDRLCALDRCCREGDPLVEPSGKLVKSVEVARQLGGVAFAAGFKSGSK